MRIPKNIRFENLIRLPWVISKALVCLLRQKIFLSYRIKPLLNTFLQNNDGSILEADTKKILKYYGLGMTFLLTEGYCLLLGKKITTKDRTVSTYLGALVGLFDDMFDSYNYQLPEVIKLYQFQEYQRKNQFEKLFIFISNKANNLIPYRTIFDYYTTKIVEVQQETKRQLESDITFQELELLTEMKGGYSLLLFYCLIESEISEKKTQALMQLGKLLQLGNDIFDIYKDNKDGIRTIPSISKDMTSFRIYFQNEIAKTISALYDTEWKSKKVELFLHFLFFLFSRCFVCLDQFEKLQLSTNNQFEVSRYSRAELICDMEKPSNFIKSIYFYLKIKLTQ